METINNLFTAEAVVPKCFLRFNREGMGSAFETELLSEHSVDAYVNGTHVMQITCTPENLTALVLGRLYTEGTICSFRDVEQIELDGNGRSVHVTLCKRPVRNKELSPLPAHLWDIGDVFLCAERFAQDTKLHARTRATHSCFLISNGMITFECEDISRHNAVDKVVGLALMNGTDLSKSSIFTSGRVPLDMAIKAIRAGIPVIISKEAATAEAVKLAEEYGLTLIGRARKDSFIVYAAGTVKRAGGQNS